MFGRLALSLSHWPIVLIANFWASGWVVVSVRLTRILGWLARAAPGAFGSGGGAAGCWGSAAPAGIKVVLYSATLNAGAPGLSPVTGVALAWAAPSIWPTSARILA